MQYRYSLYDVPFTADVPLVLPAASQQASIRLDVAQLPEEPTFPPADTMIHQVEDGWMSFRTFDSGRVEIRFGEWLSLFVTADGRRVAYRVQDQLYPTAFEAYIANFALSAALHLQGEECLHATVVDHCSRGIGFLGDSGSGKSTFAAHLVGRGARLVTDDMLRITENACGVHAEPGQPRLKLLPDAAERHFTGAERVSRWNPVSDKFLFDTADPAEPRAPCRLHMLVWLAPPDDEQPEAIRLIRRTGLHLFKIVTGATMNQKLQTPDRLARQLRFIEWLDRRVPVFELRYPRRHDVFPALIETIMQAELGARASSR